MTSSQPEQGESLRRFLVNVGAALHAYGTPSYRLEEWLSVLAKKFGQQGHFFCTPTALFAAFGPPGQQHTTLLRVEPGAVDLKQLVQLDLILNEVWDDLLTPEQGLTKIAALRQSPSRLWPGVSTLCHGLSCACAARFFGGGPREILVAGCIGLVIGVLSRLMNARQAVARVFEPVAALLGTLLVFVAQSWLGDLDSNVSTLASLVVLLPGFTLTIAISELAVQHLASGTARLMGALITLLSIGFGTAVGTKLGSLLPPPPPESTHMLPEWTLWIALLLAPLAYTVLFRARMVDVATILVGGILAFLGARYGAALTGGPELGAFCGAFVLGAFSNLYAWLSKRPAAVPMVPGMMLLVPGSLGFRSIDLLVHKDVLTGLDTAFTMTFVAISLVAGLLFANVIVPTKKIL